MSLPPPPVVGCSLDYTVYVILMLWAVGLALMLGICLGRRLR